jgi:predicted transposase/invertase (TIGR01784 family)
MPLQIRVPEIVGAAMPCPKPNEEAIEFGQQEEIMAMTEAFLTWEQETEGKGRREEKRSIALNLLRQGISIETIVQATGLTATQIQEMQSQMP